MLCVTDSTCHLIVSRRILKHYVISNWLGTIFYVSYLLFEYPLVYLLFHATIPIDSTQTEHGASTFPSGEMDVSQYFCLVDRSQYSCRVHQFWRLIRWYYDPPFWYCLHADSTLIVRFIMGLCEGSITAGFMIVTAMFYTRKEQSQRVGYWCE
jgi:MFS transporter, ACS family, DAL5 transporter family protein